VTSRIAFIFLSKLYRQMYAGTGISSDSARRKKSRRWARWTARQCKRLFQAKPMPELQSPKWEPSFLGRAFLHDDSQQEAARFAMFPEN
jgi:Fe-S cluster assembly scaffold protein SufB